MSEKIIIEFNLQEEDIMRMWRFTSWDAPHLKLKRQKAVLMILLVVAVLLAFIIHIDVGAFNKEFLLKFFIFFFLLSIPLVGGYNNRTGEGIEKKALKYLSLPENKNILGNSYFEIDTMNIFVKDANANSNLSWNSITKINISDTDFYLYFDSINALIIPKRVFESNEERNILENLLRSKMPITDYRTKNPNE